MRTGNLITQAGEDGSFHPVHRRPDAAFWHLQLDSAGQPGDHSHGATGVGVAPALVSAADGGGVAGSVAAGDGSVADCFFDVLPLKNSLRSSLRSRPTILCM